MSYSFDQLGNHIDVLSGYAFKSKDFVSTGVPVIKIKNVSPPSVMLEDLSYVSDEVANAASKFILKYDDVLIALTGSHINQMASVVGRVARVKYYKKTLLNQRVGKIIVKNSEECDLNFVYYFLSQEKVKIELAGKAGGAANQANISPSDVKNLLIPFPDAETQHKIASILRTYDDLIENNQKQIKLLEEAAQRLYKEWFVDLRFPGYETTPVVEGIPEGWSKKLVGDIIGKVPRSKQILVTEYHKNGAIPIIDQSRDFVAGYTNDVEALVDMGEPVIIFGDHTRILKYIQFPFAKGADGTQLIISDEENMPQSLLYLSLIGVDLSNYHYARHFKYLKAESILVPSKETANEFDRIVSLMLYQIQNLRDISNKCMQARDRLLPKLMNGEIEL
ncbi:MAG TPA: hypothetical protein GX726_05240 [Clostridiales bacterium]|jgi:type I restriction enzyme S subunit|nr:hypothetical protein [Clostridiales bacterium]